MSGILLPDSGECVIAGNIPWKNRVSHVKNIGVVFGQRSQLWWDVPVIDSYELLKDIYKVPKKIYKDNLEILSEELMVDNILNTPVRQLSLGQKMRAELVASLLHNPDIIFLDEPTIGLDAVSKLAIRKFIKFINKTKKVTVIITTHDMNDIEALVDRVMLIGKGIILYDGGLENLRNCFGTKKTITIDFKEKQFNLDIPGIIIENKSLQRAVIIVDTDTIAVSEVLAKMSKELDLIDVFKIHLLKKL